MEVVRGRYTVKGKANDEEYVRAGWGGRYLASDEEYEEVDSKTKDKRSISQHIHEPEPEPEPKA